MTSKKTFLNYFNAAVIVFFMYGFRFLPPIEPITQVGMGVVGILLGLIYGWTFVSIGWPSLIAIPALILTEVATKAQIYTAGLGSETMIVCLFMMIFTGLLESTGAMENIANWTLTRKIFIGRPWLFSFGLMFACMLASIVSAFAMLILFLSLMATIAKQFKLEPYGKYTTLMFLGLTLAALYGSALLPFKGNPLILAGVYYNVSGVQIDYLAYFFVGTLLKITSLVLYLLVCKYIFRADASALCDIDVKELGIEEVHFTGEQKICLSAFGILTVALFLPTIFPNVAVLKLLSGSPMVMIALSLLAIILYKGKAVANIGQAAKKGVSWDTVYLCIIILPLASYVNSEVTGINAFIIQFFTPILSSLSPLTYLVAVFTFSVIFTNFLNNTLVATLFIPVVATTAPMLGLPATPIVVILILAVHLALATPAASPFAAIMYSYSDYVRGKELIPYGFFACFLMMAWYFVLYKFVCIFF